VENINFTGYIIKKEIGRFQDHFQC